MAFHSPTRSPFSRSGKHRSSHLHHHHSGDEEDGDRDDFDGAYDDDRGAGGLSRDFRKGLERVVSKRIGVKRPDYNEVRGYIKVS